MSNTNTNKNAYIVELFGWVPEEQVYKKKDDSILSLDITTGELKLDSATEEKKSYMSVNVVKDDIVILSRERNNISNMSCMADNYNALEQVNSIDYEMRFEENRFALRFDARSASAEKNFLNEYFKLKTKRNVVERYPSGNLKIEGTKTKDGYNGMCIEYYDRVDAPIKYVGEFENGLYDGEGDFFSMDGNIRLVCKNICSGKPNGLGKLIVGKNQLNKTIDMKLYNQFTSTDNMYTNNIYAKIEPKYQEIIDLMNFDKLTLNDKIKYLYEEVQKIKSEKCKKCEEVKPSKSFFNMF